jgi:hypothetical protein
MEVSMSRDVLRAFVTASGALLLFLVVGSAPAEAVCVYCPNSMSCNTGGSTCCCNANCVGGPDGVTCTCTHKCTGCNCSGINCDTCIGDAAPPSKLVRLAKLGGPREYSLGQSTGASAGFSYSDFIRENIQRRSPLVATILNNLTTSCKTKERITLGDRSNERFGGFANERAGDFAYSGKLSVADHRATVDLVLQPDQRRKKVKNIHVEIDDMTGDVQLIETLK